MSERQMRRARERQVKREHRDGQRLGSRSKLALGAGAALGASAVLAPAAQADTFQVTSTEDELDPGPTAVECDDDCTLREALYEANDDSDGPDTITFAANVTGTITVDAGYDQFYIQEGVTIQGPGANVLAISGGDDRRVFYVNTDEEGEPHESVTISGLTLTQGFTPFYGGALYSYDSALTLADVVVDDNYAGIDGGGVWSSDGRLTITNSLFTGNVVENYDGGALALEDTEDSDADDVEVLISGSVFSGNSAGDGDGDGGALYLSSADGDVVIENTTVAGNRADDDGGGLWLRGSSSGDLTIRGSTISNNESYENDAGGAYISDIDGDILIENSTVSGNSAAYDGGGIYFDYLDEDSTTTIRNSTIVNNVAGVDPGDYGDYGGGGVYLY
ncbi:MAG: right-handed parallel beta-helix repeat-containing protein, partial [Solirubrobacterales bacterium]